MIIGIDTSTPAVSVALGDESGVVASLRLLRGRRHVETVIPAIEQLLAHADCSYAEVTGIAIDRGPGLFTGLRVGVATAKALALSLNVPVFVASSLEVLVYQWIDACVLAGVVGTSEPGGREVLAVIDARRREVYAQRFVVVGRSVAESDEPKCLAPAEACALVGGRTQTQIIGDGAVGLVAFADYPVSAASPDAATLVAMAPALAPTDPDELELLYLRAPDAEINWTSRP